MVHGLLIASAGLIEPNVTHFLDFTLKASLVFKMDVGVLVHMLDSDESDDPTVATVCGGDWCARLQL